MISGPAGVTWGTNAVNGVINVVTLSAAKTSGVAVNTTLGTLERNAVARYGVALSDELAVRAHVRTFERGPSQTRGGGDAGDTSRGTTGGIRVDWNRGQDAAALIAGAYTGKTDERPAPVGRVELSGANMTARWSRRLSETSNFDLQAYADSTKRKDQFLLQEDAQIFDVEAKFRETLGAHRWLVGGGYRRARDRSEPGLIFAFIPAEKRQHWYNAFVQDEVAVTAELALTLGMRFEHNPYSGWESLPSVHLGYKLGPDSLLWGALSRAVRSPARFDREIFVPTQPPFFIAGGPDFTSEVANVAELGYRAQLGTDASLSATAFVQDYDRLRSLQTIAASTNVFQNGIEGQVRGLEAWGNWRPVRSWRLDAGLLW